MVPILGPKCNKMGPQRQPGIYVGFDSASIICYLEPTTGDVFKARFVDCHFFETTFPKLHATTLEVLPDKLQWKIDFDFWNDPRTC
jgi:hypothetical protein